MLHFLRRHSQSKLIQGIFFVIIAVFVLWGVEAVVSGGNALTTVATVDGRPIEQIEIQRAERNLAEAYRNAYKENFSPELRQALNLRQRALNGLIDRLVLLNQAEALGLEVPDQELRDVIVSSPGFQAGGRFSKDQYVRALRYSGMTPGEYEELRRQDLAVERLQNLVQDAVSVSDAEVRDDVIAREEKRTISFVKFPAAEHTATVEVADEELQKFYADNKGRYAEPEKIKVEMLAYRPEKFTEGVEIGEEEIEQYYDENRTTRFTQPQEVRARHILISVPRDADEETRQKARARLEEIKAKVDAGGDFAELAREHSEDPGSKEQGGDLGFFPRGRMVGPFEDAAFSLEPGQSSDVVESPFGLHLIRVEEVREEREKPLEEVREEIVTALRQEQGKEKAAEVADADRQALAAGKTMDEIAAERGLTVERPEPFARAAPIPGLGRSLPLTNAMWDAAPGTVTEPVDVDGVWVIARNLEIVPSSIPEFDAVKDRVEAAYRLQKAGEAAKAEAEKLLAAAKEAGSLKDAAEQAGKSIESAPPLTRASGFAPGVAGSPEVKDAVFALSAESPLPDRAFVVSGDAYAVALEETEVPSDEEVALELDEARKKLVEERRAQTFQRYLEELKKRSQIEVDPQRLESIPAV